MFKKHLQEASSELLQAIVIGAVVGIALMMSYMAFEPVVGRSATSDFLVTQEITGEVSFTVASSSLRLTPAIASLTGGTSTGNNEIVVSTNNSSGYTLTMVFSSSTAMNANNGTSSIPNYVSADPAEPDFDFAVADNLAGFGYSVAASSSLDVADFFEYSGSDCGLTGTASYGRCWTSPSTTARQIIVTSGPAAGGSTSTIQFRLVVRENPNPAIPTDVYTATATLTAATNP